MKQQKFATRIILALILATLIAVPAASLRAQSSAEPTTARVAAQGGGILDVLEQARQAQAQQLEGAWAYTVTPVVPPGVPQPPSQRAYITVARGGGLSVYIRTGPGGPFYGEQHGVWEHMGGNEFALTAIRDEFDAQGNFLGTGKINTRLTLTGKDGFVGVGSREFRDPTGNIADITRCATIKAERIKIEPLAPQCQSITPPQ
ncbi:MAG: hypothetical protein HY011_33475 [Acidobacteria bacterium]|nr:hypothetical protein [Acidobacteriota bacterium]